MTGNSQSVREDIDGLVRRYDYDDESVIVADFGHADGTVDVVEGTAIVVVDGEQEEFEVPAGSSRAVMNNGIVTVEVER